MRSNALKPTSLVLLDKNSQSAKSSQLNLDGHNTQPIKLLYIGQKHTSALGNVLRVKVLFGPGLCASTFQVRIPTAESKGLA